MWLLAFAAAAAADGILSNRFLDEPLLRLSYHSTEAGAFELGIEFRNLSPVEGGFFDTRTERTPQGEGGRAQVQHLIEFISAVTQVRGRVNRTHTQGA